MADTKASGIRERHYGALRKKGYGATLQFRLTVLIITAVLLVLSAGMLLDHYRTYREQVDATLASLEEQAHALIVARSRITEQGEWANYVDDFCAQMNKHISPGHHILVLDETGAVSVRSRRHSGADVEQALLSRNSEEPILVVGRHKLAYVSIRAGDGATIIIAQYLDHMERILQSQLISRGLSTGATAIIIILLIYVVMKVWVITPVNSLAAAARQWATRTFSARAEVTGPADFRLLADEFNSMSEELQRHQRNQTAELEQARQIQLNLLPVKQPSVSGLEIAAEYRPAQHVAGDLYDIFSVADGKTCIVVLDVCGHGISAALLTGVVKMSLHRRLAETDDLGEAVRMVNEDLLGCTPTGHFVTACVGIWNEKDLSWSYCAAGHTGGLLVRQGRAESLESTAPLLGVFAGKDWATNAVKLSAGDRVFLYTDGVVETGLSDGQFEVYDLQKALTACMDLSISEQVASIMTEATRRSSGKMKDDATIAAFEVLVKTTLRNASPVR